MRQHCRPGTVVGPRGQHSFLADSAAKPHKGGITSGGQTPKVAWPPDCVPPVGGGGQRFLSPAHMCRINAALMAGGERNRLVPTAYCGDPGGHHNIVGTKLWPLRSQWRINTTCCLCAERRATLSTLVDSCVEPPCDLRPARFLMP